MSFTTEFGETIPFVPGYYERNSFYANFGLTRSTILPEYYSGSVRTTPVPFYLVARDWVMFSSIIRFLLRSGLLSRWTTGIDLGGAEGTIIRLFRAFGLIRHATNLDLDDYSKVVDDAYFSRFLDKISRLETDKDADATSIKEAVMWIKWAFDYYPEFPLTGGGGGLHMAFPEKPTLDQNLQMSVLDVSGTYDLVTSFKCFDFLDLDEAFAKVRSILAPGGLFVGHMTFAWWVITPGGIVGHFPYAAQRLSPSDLARYFAEHHPPDMAANLDRRQFYMHSGKQVPTLRDWVAVAKKHGLRTVAYERVMPKKHERVPDTPPQMLKTDWFDVEAVLRDIHRFRPDVCVDDLFTQGLTIAMVRA